jgi:small subunit ribosomal protein S18
LRREKKKEADRRKKPDIRFIRRKVCRFCKGKIETISYRDVETLTNFISERGRIIPARISGNCARHQRIVSRAIKRAREVAFLPFCT